MKKNIRSLLLPLVMVLSMTACVANNDTLPATSEPTTSVTIAEQTGETETELNVQYLMVTDIEAMTSEDVSAYFDELVRLSESDNLSSQDMYQLGANFEHIWWYNNSACNMDEFEAKATEAFNNIYTKALEQKIPLDELYSWTFSPVADVLEKYFSSSNFASTEYLACAGFYALEEDDAIRVATACFENPLFAINCDIAISAIFYPCDEVNDMGWAHLIALSNTTNPIIAEYTEWVCTKVFHGGYLSDADKLYEISQNILQNPLYDFVEKYTFFCHGLHDDISNMAFEQLIELAKNADEETYELIMQVADEMRNTDAAAELLNVLEGNS